MAIYVFYHPDDGAQPARTLHTLIEAAGLAAILDDGGNDLPALRSADLALIVGTPFAIGSAVLAYIVTRCTDAGVAVHWVTPTSAGYDTALHIAQDHRRSQIDRKRDGERGEFRSEPGSTPPTSDDTKSAVRGGESEERSDAEPMRGIPADLLDGFGQPAFESSPPQPTPIIPPAPPAPRPAPAPVSPATPPLPSRITPDLMGERRQPLTGGITSPSFEAKASDDPIQFSAYFPGEMKPNDWQPLRAYIFKESAAREVERDVQRELADLLERTRKVIEAARGSIAEGALITATPDLPGFQFNPPMASVAFYEAWHRFDFKLRASTVAPYTAANGRITFRVEGVIVADLPLSIYVSPQAGATLSGGQMAAAARPYRAIFCSYSHRDTPIVLRVERAIRTLGDDFLRDATTLRSGEDWNAALLAMIDRADIFQLFWSGSASASKYVRQEWEYALAKMTRAGVASFIRPVYWEDPMPAPPPELGHLHFAHDPTLDDV